jgi:hypothetical protein
MYYNNNDKILIRRLPKNIIKPDGSLFIDFNLADINTLSDYGFYTLRNDNSVPPSSNSIENISNRQIILDKPYFDIIREWKQMPSPTHYPTQPKEPPQELLEDVL